MSITLNGTSGITTADVTTDTLTSNGIDDNATSTAITIASNGHTSISGAGSTSNNSTAEVLSVAGDNHVRQSISTSSTGGHQASLTLESNSNEVAIGTAGSNEMRFSTNAAERMRIDSSGKFFVGTTSEESSGGAAAAPTAAGFGYFKSSKNTLYANCTDSSNLYEPFGLIRQNSTGNYAGFWYGLNTQTGTISTNGSSTSYNTTSDYRLKENVVDLDNATDRLKQIPVHRFNFIADPDTTVDGFLAHEVADVVPEAISGAKDAVDDEGNPVYQGIDQSKLVPLLVATIQELEARIAALETP